MSSVVCVIVTIHSPVELPIREFTGQFRIRLISQLFKGIARAPQKLLKYFNGTASYVNIFCITNSRGSSLNLNDSEFDKIWFIHP